MSDCQYLRMLPEVERCDCVPCRGDHEVCIIGDCHAIEKLPFVTLARHPERPDLLHVSFGRSVSDEGVTDLTFAEVITLRDALSRLINDGS